MHKEITNPRDAAAINDDPLRKLSLVFRLEELQPINHHALKACNQLIRTDQLSETVILFEEPQYLHTTVLYLQLGWMLRKVIVNTCYHRRDGCCDGNEHKKNLWRKEVLTCPRSTPRAWMTDMDTNNHGRGAIQPCSTAWI